jgi:hypothetical protein
LVTREELLLARTRGPIKFNFCDRLDGNKEIEKIVTKYSGSVTFNTAIEKELDNI